MTAYTPLPTNNDRHSDDVDTSSSKKTIAALVVLSLCAGSVAVISNSNRTIPIQQSSSLYVSACLQGAADNAVLDGYDMVCVCPMIFPLSKRESLGSSFSFLFLIIPLRSSQF